MYPPPHSRRGCISTLLIRNWQPLPGTQRGRWSGFAPVSNEVACSFETDFAKVFCTAERPKLPDWNTLSRIELLGRFSGLSNTYQNPPTFDLLAASRVSSERRPLVTAAVLLSPQVFPQVVVLPPTIPVPVLVLFFRLRITIKECAVNRNR